MSAIYLNHAGTSWPRPAVVTAALLDAQESAPEAWASTLGQATLDVSRILGIRDPERFLFTSGCTAALAIALASLPYERGDRVIISGFEHHALARPLQLLAAQRGVEVLTAPGSATAPIDMDAVERLLRAGGVRMIATTMASNVTGALLPVGDLAQLAHAHGALSLVDAAQTVGLFALDVAALGADIFVFAGHKGARGPQGVGGLYVSSAVPLSAPAAVCDVTAAAREPGGRSCEPTLSYCDSGSAPLAAAAGLAAGLRTLDEMGWPVVERTWQRPLARLLAGLAELPGLEIVGPPTCEARSTAVSVRARGRAPAELERALAQRNVITRAGQHCAPLAHERLGTGPAGTLRLSPGLATTDDEIDSALHALREILDP